VCGGGVCLEADELDEGRDVGVGDRPPRLNYREGPGGGMSSHRDPALLFQWDITMDGVRRPGTCSGGEAALGHRAVTTVCPSSHSSKPREGSPPAGSGAPAAAGAAGARWRSARARRGRCAMSAAARSSQQQSLARSSCSSAPRYVMTQPAREPPRALLAAGPAGACHGRAACVRRRGASEGRAARARRRRAGLGVNGKPAVNR
jgi:hypothetical protein